MASAVLPLLAADEPAAATLVNEARGAVFFLACHHAGRAIPSPAAWAATMRDAMR